MKEYQKELLQKFQEESQEFLEKKLLFKPLVELVEFLKESYGTIFGRIL